MTLRLSCTSVLWKTLYLAVHCHPVKWKTDTEANTGVKKPLEASPEALK